MRVYLRTNISKKLQERLDKFELDHFLEEGETPESFYSHQKEKYYSIPFATVIAYEKGDIVGRILLHKRKIIADGEEILLGGIGGVCTHREMRRKGVASKLLDCSMKNLKKENCDIVFLCTDIPKLSPLYSNFGFVPLGREYKFKGNSGKFYTDNDGMIAPGLSPKIFGKILNSKTTFNLVGGNW